MKPFGLIPALAFGVASTMSYNRWKQIKKFLCVYNLKESDLHADGPMKGRVKDKLAKVRPLVNLLQRNFVAFWKPGIVWAIDESIVPFRGRWCSFKVYMKDKPHKFGMKIWMLNDAVRNYCYKFKVYLGAGDVFPGEDMEQMRGNWSIGERCILYFARYVQKGSYLFTDRFFTTPKAAYYCFKRWGVYLTGTVMTNKKLICRSILYKKAKKYARGFFTFAVDAAKHVIMVCWMDRTPVLMLSTMLGANLAQGVKRLTHLVGMFCIWHTFWLPLLYLSLLFVSFCR